MGRSQSFLIVCICIFTFIVAPIIGKETCTENIKFFDNRPESCLEILNFFTHTVFPHIVAAVTTVYPHIIAEATILFWNFQTLKISNSFLIKFSLM